MDLNSEVVKLLFPDGIPDEWQDGAEFSIYLSDIGAYGIDRLSKEADRVSEEQVSLLEQTQELAFCNYKTFIQTADCSKTLYNQFGQVENELDSLLVKLPEFAQRCEKFSKFSQEVSAHRCLNSLTLAKHPQLLEILELPQLMDTCVRNAYYEEALELAAYVKRIQKKLGTIPLIQSIVTAIQESLQLMLTQLLLQLRLQLQLPQCLRLIGYLRQMDVFTEGELRLKFLQGRDAWIQSQLAAVPKIDNYQHITKSLELFRVQLFDIVTQYRAVFGDDPVSPLKSDPTVHKTALFYGFINNTISQVITLFQTALDKGVGSMMDSLLAQTMYFGLSFARLGADMRPLLVPLFTKAAYKQFEEAVSKAEKSFQLSLEGFTLMKTELQTSLPRNNPSDKANAESHHPPLSLTEFHPMVELCNGILVGFNDMRGCTPIAIACQVCWLVQKTLQRAAKSLTVFYHQEESALTSTEADSFKRLAQVFVHDFIPFIQSCLLAMFPPAYLADLLGKTVTDSKMIVTLDIVVITEPLLTFVKVPVIEVRTESPEKEVVSSMESSTTSAERFEIPSSMETSIEKLEMPNTVNVEQPDIDVKLVEIANTDELVTKQIVETELIQVLNPTVSPEETKQNDETELIQVGNPTVVISQSFEVPLVVNMNEIGDVGVTSDSDIVKEN